MAEVGFERCYDNWLHTLQIIAFDLFEWLLGCLYSSLWSMYLYIVFAPLRSIVVTFPFERHIYLFSCAPVLYEHSTPACLSLARMSVPLIVIVLHLVHSTFVSWLPDLCWAMTHYRRVGLFIKRQLEKITFLSCTLQYLKTDQRSQ